MAVYVFDPCPIKTARPSRYARVVVCLCVSDGPRCVWQPRKELINIYTGNAADRVWGLNVDRVCVCM